MDESRLRCAEVALRSVPDNYRSVSAADVSSQSCGHSLHHGMHIAWAWGADERSREYLDFLSDHPHPGMEARRYYVDGATEEIDTPDSTRAVSPDPVEDARLERALIERNRAVYADLHARGLLPPQGVGGGSQGVNEYLLTGGSVGERDTQLLGGGWDEVLADELAEAYWSNLLEFVDAERQTHTVYPPQSQTFRAFAMTPHDKVKVVILGQDPYPNPGEAHGLAFSVPSDLSYKPGSLRNIHTVLETDLSKSLGRPVTAPECGSLEGWAEQGVLLLNTALTVRAGTKEERKLHRQWKWEGQGWSTFTDAVIRAVNDKEERVVFILWGEDAKKKQALITAPQHVVITSTHPSPLSAYRGFLTSTPFSDANKALTEHSRGEIAWERAEPDA